MPDDDCACGMKYRTGGLVVATVQMVLGLLLTITGFVTINYDCDDEYEDETDYECWNETWVSWSVAIGGCVCMTAAGLLLLGVRATRPNWLMVYVAMAGCSAINYALTAVLAICYRMKAIFVVLLFATSLWLLYTVVFVFKYRRIMISQLPQVILATPYLSRDQFPGAPVQVLVTSNAQPGAYPAPYNLAPPGAYHGNLNPSSPYPMEDTRPPPYYAATPPSPAGSF